MAGGLGLEHELTGDRNSNEIDLDAIVISAPRSVRTEQLVLPGPRKHELVVRIELCGLCTPEQRVYRGAKPTYPYWGGHEVCGILEYVPPGTDQRMIAGSRVVVGLMRRCGQCRACDRGLDNHCAYLEATVSDGLPAGPRGLSRRLAVPVYKAFPVPAWLPPEKAVLAEPIACVLHSILQGAPQPGDVVLVVGAGMMGLLHTVLLSIRGCRVIVVDRDATTHDAAIRAGASIFGPLKVLSDRDQLQSLTDGWGPDLVFCTRFGSWAVEAAVRVVGRGGRIVLYQSIPGGGTVALDPNDLHYREVRLIGTIAQKAGDLAGAVEVLSAHPTQFDCLRVDIIPASRPIEAFERALRPEVNRVAVDFRE